MRRFALVVAVALPVLTTPGFAGKLEKTLEGRWRGAWVVTTVALQSDCAGFRTDNLVSGTLVSSKGRHAFPTGEIARVDKVNVHRSGLELDLSLPEPILVSHREGPFTLYDEARCMVELDVDLPRALVSNDDVAGIEAALRPIVERYSSQGEAQQSRSWNQRKRESYPADYQRTLADYQAWKAQQVNAGIQARLDRALDETTRLTDRLTSDRDYLAGFAAGVEAMKAIDLSRCGDLMARDFGNLGSPPQTPQPYVSGSEPQQRWTRGYQDGLRLIFGLSSLRYLPQCFVPGGEAQAAQRGPMH